MTPGERRQIRVFEAALRRIERRQKRAASALADAYLVLHRMKITRLYCLECGYTYSTERPKRGMSCPNDGVLLRVTGGG